MDRRESEPARSPKPAWRRRLLIAAGALLLVAAAVWLSAGRVIATKLERDLRSAGWVDAQVVGASWSDGGVAVRRIRLAGDDFEVEGVRADIGTSGVEKLSVDTLRLRTAVDADGRIDLPGGFDSGDGAGNLGAALDLVPPDGLEVASADVVLTTPSGPAALLLTALQVERGNDDARAAARYTLEHASGRLQGAVTAALAHDGALQARVGIEDGRLETQGVRIARLNGQGFAAVPAQGSATIELALAAAETKIGEHDVGALDLTAVSDGRNVDFSLEAQGPLAAEAAIEGRAVYNSRLTSLEAEGRARLERDDARGELTVSLQLANNESDSSAAPATSARSAASSSASSGLSGRVQIGGRGLTLPALFSEASFDLAADVEANAESVRLTSAKAWAAELTPAPALLPESMRALIGERVGLTLTPREREPLTLLVTREKSLTRLDAALGRAAIRNARAEATGARLAASLAVNAVIGNGSPPSVDASFEDGALTLPDQRVAIGGARGALRVANGKLDSATLAATAVESKAEPPLWAPLALEASVSGDDAALELEALLSDALGIVVLEIAGRTEDGSGTADLTLHPLQFVPGATQVEDLSPALAERVTDASGSLAFTGTLQWDADGTRSSGELEAKALAATVSGTRIAGIDGTAMLSSLVPPATPPDQTLTIETLDVGVPLTDGTVVYGLESDGRVAIQELTFDLAGGRVATEPFTFDSGALSDLRFVLEAEDVDLSQVLELSQIEGLEGTGALSGRVPIRVSASGVALDDGVLAAETNGILRYTPENLPEFLRGDDVRSRMLREALTNFQYDELVLTITGESEDDAEQLVRLSAKGANPDFLEGHPIELNFNFRGPLLGAVRSAVDLSSAEAVQQLFEQQDQRELESAP